MCTTQSHSSFPCFRRFRGARKSLIESKRENFFIKKLVTRTRHDDDKNGKHEDKENEEEKIYIFFLSVWHTITHKRIRKIKNLLFVIRTILQSGPPPVVWATAVCARSFAIELLLHIRHVYVDVERREHNAERPKFDKRRFELFVCVCDETF